MAVESTHPLYDDLAPLWHKVRLAMGGEDKVKMFGGSAILPIPEGMVQTSINLLDPRQSTGDYDNYKTRAMFYEATSRTVLGLTGAVMRKRPVVEFPESRRQLLQDLTPNGENLEQLASTLVRDVCSVGRAGLLVDAPLEESNDLLPYISYYTAENITNWRKARVNGRWVKVMVVLKECEEIPDTDEFSVTTKIRYRVLKLGAPSFAIPSREEVQVFGSDRRPTVPELIDFYNLDLVEDRVPFYWQEVWLEDKYLDEKGQEQTRFVLDHRIFPRKKGGRLWSEIPFEFVNPDDTEEEPCKPPILPLVNVNFSHYRDSADLQWGLHFTALPTAWAAGFSIKEGQKLTIGASAAWVTDEPSARCAYLEFTGAGLSAIERSMDRKEKMMAILGARLLEEQKSGVEAAEAIKLRHAGEFSVLVTIAKTCTQALSHALKWVGEWLGFDPEKISVKLNTDFNVIGLDPQQLQVLMGALQQGAMSFEVFYHQLAKGEMYPDGWTLEDEKKRIEAGAPKPPQPEPAGQEPFGGRNPVGGVNPRPRLVPKPKEEPVA